MKTVKIPVYENIAVFIKYCAVCLKHRLYTYMLRGHLFSIFIVKMPQALAALASLGLLIVNALTKCSLTITNTKLGMSI